MIYMNIINAIVVILIIVALSSFFYKIYLQIKITNPSKKVSLF
jgi:hypothetical protein